ncbi:hypothetical protein AKJ09_07453 [Labilithrix luteola]|uniref:Uncharacterized protein n=1 Tax=Labilithrix luteola TaxID=1391654 RepID=A0A0K1Q5W8_9BACT|nr:hypothetical protein AKJ09_07453 [Labilithrix luteola]
MKDETLDGRDLLRPSLDAGDRSPSVCDRSLPGHFRRNVIDFAWRL